MYYWQLQKSWCCCQDLKWKFWNHQISVYTTTTLAFGKGLWRSAIINKQCFEEDEIPDVLGFGLIFLYLEEGRKSIRHLCLCLAVSVSLWLSFDVAISFRENEKSVAKSLSHVAIWVGYAPGAGGGVFAVRDIAVSDLIHTDPVVAHPALASLQKVCSTSSP